MQDRIRTVTRQVLNEYLDKDYMIPLKRYLNMSDEDKAYECAGRLPWLLKDFIENNSEAYEIIDELIGMGKLDSDVLEMDSWDMAEAVGPLFNGELAQFAEEFISYVSQNGNTEVPLFVVADYEKDVKNEWLVHMTDNLSGVSHEGFNVGVSIDELAYTPGRGTTKYKYGPGYNFAFTADDAYHAERTGYGKYCILFQASGVQIYHYGDEEKQVIFYGPSARNLIFIYKEEYGDYSGSWVIKSEITDRLLCHFDYLLGCVNWAIQNFPQYRDHLVGRYKQRVGFERRRAMPDEKAWWRDKKEKIAESVGYGQSLEDAEYISYRFDDDEGCFEIDDCMDGESRWMNIYPGHMTDDEIIDYFGEETLEAMKAGKGRQVSPAYRLLDVSRTEETPGLDNMDAINAYLKKIVPTTANWRVCGWILTDGTMLSYEVDGTRGQDHNQYITKIDGLDKFEFVKMGAIRCYPEGRFIRVDIRKEPTMAQYSRLTQIFSRARDVEIDLGSEVYSTNPEFEEVRKAPRNTAALIDLIVNFYKGNRAYKSPLMRFHQMDEGIFSRYVKLT